MQCPANILLLEPLQLGHFGADQCGAPCTGLQIAISHEVASNHSLFCGLTYTKKVGCMVSAGCLGGWSMFSICGVVRLNIAEAC